MNKCQLNKILMEVLYEASFIVINLKFHSENAK